MFLILIANLGHPNCLDPTPSLLQVGVAVVGVVVVT